MNATRLYLRALLPTCLLAVLGTTGSLAAQGKSITVGPTGMQPDIQNAINWINANAASPTDWVVLVDPNAIQPYGPFLIDGLTPHAGRISIVSSVPGQRYMVRGPSGQVTIRNVFGGQTTVADLQTTYDDGTVPAISANFCLGMLRLRNIDIEERQNLDGVPARAVIDLDFSLNNMLWDIRVWREAARHGWTTDITAGNDGLSALFVRVGRLQAHQVFLQGYNNTVGPAGYGGDAVRLIDAPPFGPIGVDLWLTTFLQPTYLQGGNATNYGGSCVHSLPIPLRFLEQCGSSGVGLAPGTGGVANGGAYTINNMLPSNLIPPACLLEHWGHTDAPTTMPINATTNLLLASNFTRAFVLHLDLTPIITPTAPGLAGLLFMNSSLVVIGNGVLTASPQPFPLTLANDPALIGLQVAFQTAMSPAGTSSWWLASAPTETTIVP